MMRANEGLVPTRMGQTDHERGITLDRTRQREEDRDTVRPYIY